MSLDVVALVPMRHSSERVPGKNYRPFNGVPLFHRIVSTLLVVERIAKVVIDTDSPTVTAQVAESFPTVQVIDRPEHLLGGHTPMTEVLRHDAEQVPSAWYLQTHTTNPLLRPETIDAAIDRMEADGGEHDSLFSVTRWQTRLYAADGTPINHDPDVLLRTQDLPPVFEENSNLYLFTAEQIATGRRIGKRPILFEIDPLEAVDIDVETDFVLAEALDRHLAEQHGTRPPLRATEAPAEGAANRGLRGRGTQ
jgi:CMP-N-acetylneuraminic acid synthetase